MIFAFVLLVINQDFLLWIGLFSVVLSWELASTLKESKSRFDAAGVKLIAVGVGAPNKARILAERVMLPSPPLSFKCLTVFLGNYEALKVYHHLTSLSLSSLGFFYLFRVVSDGNYQSSIVNKILPNRVSRTWYV